MWGLLLSVACAAVLVVEEVGCIADGHVAPSVPWQAAIYKKGQGDLPVCGGTLVAEDIVLSSAACFTDEFGEKEDLNDFIVVVGKKKSSKNVKENTAQERQVKELVLPERFKGDVLFSSSNIAVVKLSEPIVPSEAVKLVNLDLDQDDNDLQGQQGQVAGWGLMENDRQSDELRAANLPFVNFTMCYDSVPNNFRPRLTPDKICAGTLDGAYVCRGDFGSGWTVAGSDGQQYLRAILSEAQTWASFKGQCKRGVAALTSIAAQRDWLQPYLRPYLTSSAESLNKNCWLFVVTFLCVLVETRRTL